MIDPVGLIGAAGGVQQADMLRHAAPAAKGPSFQRVLMEHIARVDRLQQEAEKAIGDLATGPRGDLTRHDLTQVLAAKQKADSAFEVLLEVRNKLQDAYDEVKQMRV